MTTVETIDAKIDGVATRLTVFETQQTEALRRQDEILVRLGKIEAIGLDYQLHRAEMRPFEKILWGVIGTAVTAFSVGLIAAIQAVMR